jgi:hypothetical protein
VFLQRLPSNGNLACRPFGGQRGAGRRGIKKKATPGGRRLTAVFDLLLLIGTAGPVTTATPAGRAEIDAGVDAEPIAHEINADGFGFLIKFFVDDKLETVDVENIVGVARLIQSHGQRRPSSSAFVQKNTNRLNVLVLKVFRNLLMSRRGDFYHDGPPRWYGKFG